MRTQKKKGETCTVRPTISLLKWASLFKTGRTNTLCK